MTGYEAVQLRHAYGSDIGQRRTGNEDSAYATDRVLAVADGMGGHAAGEVASALATAAMEALDVRAASADSAGDDVDLVQLLSDGVADAAARLAEKVEADSELAGMGTTLTAMLWQGTTFALAHIGDSRGYLLRDGKLTQLTKDHTMVQSLVDEGKMPAELAATHPSRSVLINALMAEAPGEPDLSLHTAEPGDRYLLCSDGLTDPLGDDEIHEVLTSVEDPEDAVDKLIELANDGGGPDNITCVLVDVVAGGEPG